MKKRDQNLSEKFKQHLLNTVGATPTKIEIKEIDKKVRKSFDKIYNSPNKKPSFLKEEYDKNLSKVWARVVAHEASISEINLFLKYSNIKENSKIVSLASGICVFELFVAKEIANKGNVCCVDISNGMITEAKKFVKKLSLKNVKLIVKDITKLPFNTDSQEIVLARRTGLSNDDRWIEVLKESYRVLKKNEDSRFIYTVDHDFTKPLNLIKKDLSKANLKFIAQDAFLKKDQRRVDMIVAKPL